MSTWGLGVVFTLGIVIVNYVVHHNYMYLRGLTLEYVQSKHGNVRTLRPVKDKRELYGKARIAVGGQAPEAEVDSGGGHSFKNL